MSWFLARIYDRFMAETEEACLAGWRRELLADVAGDVLELGAGTGRNLDHYPPVHRLVLSEPDPHMRRILAARARRHSQPVDVRADPAEAVRVDDASFDVVVTTLVLCSVDRADRALQEIFRVLRPGGRFVFLEHVAADAHSARRRWQDRLDPLWCRIADGCHLNRPTEATILEAGFELERVQRESMRKALPIVRPSIRGVARRPDHEVGAT